MSESEFNAIIINTGEPRPLMSKPRRLQGTKKFIRHVQDNLNIPDAQAFEAADWVLNLMERYGARTAQSVFTMEGSGPNCSWCGAIWPLCGHHHMSENLPEDESEPSQVSQESPSGETGKD